MVDINVDLLQWFINFFGGVIKNENMSKKELAEELQKPIIRKLKKKRKLLSLTFYRQYLGC